MLVKLKLKNSDVKAVISQKAHDFIRKNKQLSQLGFLDNLRLHSHGYVFFQKSYPLKDGSYQTITIYLHKLIAKQFMNAKAGKKNEKIFIHFKNGKRSDCSESNLEVMSMQEMVRTQNKSRNATGFRGVVKDGNKYKAMLYDKSERYYLGRFDTAEEAAEAYNKKSQQLFGKNPFLNKVTKQQVADAKAKAARKKGTKKTTAPAKKTAAKKAVKAAPAKKTAAKKAVKAAPKKTVKKVSKPAKKATKKR